MQILRNKKIYVNFSSVVSSWGKVDYSGFVNWEKLCDIEMVPLNVCFRGHLLIGSLEWEDGDEEVKGKVEGTAWLNRILRTHANDFIFSLNEKEEVFIIFKELKPYNLLEQQDKTTRILSHEETLSDSLLIKYAMVE